MDARLSTKDIINPITVERLDLVMDLVSRGKISKNEAQILLGFTPPDARPKKITITYEQLRDALVKCCSCGYSVRDKIAKELGLI